MTYVNVTIKGINEKVYRKAKSIAAEEDVNIGEVMNEALEKLIEEKKHKWKKIDANDPLFTGQWSMDYGIDTDVKNADKYIYQ